MTKQQFDKLKVGDVVCLRNPVRDGGFTMTEVLEIDRFFRKVRVLLKNEFQSYRRFPLKVDWSKVRGIVGTCKLREY
jgi:hypothetical protein